MRQTSRLVARPQGHFESKLAQGPLTLHLRSQTPLRCMGPKEHIYLGGFSLFPQDDHVWFVYANAP